METYRLTGEVTINFDTYFNGNKKGAIEFINKFNEFALQLERFKLETKDEECQTEVRGSDFKWLTLEDEEGCIQNLQEDLSI